jgi:hypothetical protein
MRLFGIIILSFLSLEISAQSAIIKSLERPTPGEGKVTIHQDESIAKLLGGQRTATAKTETEKSAKTTKGKVTPATENKEKAAETTTIAKSPSERPSTPVHPKRVKDENGTEVTLDMDGDIEEAPKKIVKVAGYRVQVYAGNNTRTAKMEARQTGENVRQYFPEVPVYTFFYTPRWLCRVGDFRSMEEAYAMLRKLKATHVFKEVSIVKDRVNVTL